MGGSGTYRGISAKWWGVVAALWVQAISGNNYTFSNYSVELKAILDCNQVELNGLSSAKDVGKAFGVLAGLLADVIPPWAILLIGSIEGLLGYGVQWLVVGQKISPPPYWAMCIVMCMGGNSTTWMNTAVLVTCVRNFRRNRGPISGILKGYIGLSTAIFTDLCAALFTGSASSFVLMLSLLPLGVCIVAMFLLRPAAPADTPEEEHVESRCFAFLNATAILLAFYLLAYDLGGSAVDSVIFSRAVAAGLLVIVLSPAVLPVYLKFKFRSPASDMENSVTEPLLAESSKANVQVNGESSGNKQDLEKKKAMVDEDDDEAGVVRQGKRIGDEFTVVEAVKTVDFWILFVCFLCGVGTGMAVINNMGQIGESMGYTSVSIFVSMISIWGFFGRLGSGALSEQLIRWKAVPRPAVLAASQLVMAAGYAVLATGFGGSLYIGSIIVGACYGIRIAVSVPLVSELFGLKAFGLMYNILILNLPLGSFLFSSLLSGILYDIEAAKDGSSTTCLGSHCYRLVFVVMAAVSGAGFLLDSVLTFRTRSLYARIQRSKLRTAG